MHGFPIVWFQKFEIQKQRPDHPPIPQGHRRRHVVLVGALHIMVLCRRTYHTLATHHGTGHALDAWIDPLDVQFQKLEIQDACIWTNSMYCPTSI